MLEPIFEADFVPVSYGFRPMRRAHDAIAEIHHYGTQGYRWVLDADIEACFDSIDHTALMDRVRRRVKDKRVLASGQGVPQGRGPHRGRRPRGHPHRHAAGRHPVPAAGQHRPVGARRAPARAVASRAGRCPPPTCAAGVASTACRGGESSATRTISSCSCTAHEARRRRPARRRRYRCSHPLGLRLSAAKTHVVHMSDGFDFLGFHIQWKRKRGTNKWHVYTFIADRPIRSVKAKIRALTRRTSQQEPRDRADPAQPDHARLGQLLQARRLQTHAQSPVTLRVVAGDPVAAQRCTAGRGRTSDAGSPPPPGMDTDHGRTGSRCSTSHRCRSPDTATGATRSPTPGPCPTTPARQEPWRARCGESRTPGSASGLGKRTEQQCRHRAPGRLNRRRRSCCAWTRSPRSRRWTAPSRRCRWCRAAAETMTHDYMRHGTTTLFAALDVLTGKVIGQCTAPAPAYRVPEVPQHHRPRGPRRTCRST